MISREVVTSVLAQSESKQTDHWCDLSPNVQNSPHSVPGINLTQLRSGHPVFRRCRCLGCNEKHQWDSRCFVNLAALHSSCSIGAPHATKPSLRLKQTWSTSVKTAFIHSQAQFSICKHWNRCVIAYRWTFSEDGAHDGLLYHRQRPARPLLCVTT